ncbi:hypothetical protein CBR_g20424 [Chara braunii]|uniref:Uncharacterized protein n=1 Tax=Chara braunii TaxID=69332 RepID=A0A388JUF7_CHABU|nr:hypothetical protein CBR_g20424 [Chara braunii]|eukprot:GBG61393.1 hypothetical protein CBR_g20424 [Chara braunii]
MTTPAKRTPRRTESKKKLAITPGRVTRSKAKLKTKLSPYVEKFEKILEQPSSVQKLRYRNQEMEDLRSLDALELQGICKDEHVAYNDKIDAIFDIASHRTRVDFGEVNPIDVSRATELLDEESLNEIWRIIEFVTDYRGKLEHIDRDAEEVLRLCILVLSCRREIKWNDENFGLISLDDVVKVKECEGFVLTPMDRNMRKTLVMCPGMYHKAMMEAFVSSPGYRVVQDEEGVVLARVRSERINTKVERGKHGKVEAASYDIKEMFSRLPHDEILDVVA